MTLPSRAAHRLTPLALALGAILGACRNTVPINAQMVAGADQLRRDAESDDPSQRVFRVMRVRDPESGVVLREWEAYVETGRRAVRHGKEVVRFPSGALQWERHYKLGEPVGEWTSWYENGQMRSNAVFAGRDEPTEMRFWHANGQLSAHGPARNGEREGHWQFFYPGGQPHSEGRYVDSLRDGDWTHWYPDGEIEAQGRYIRNRRVGRWKVDDRSDRDGPREAAADPAP